MAEFPSVTRILLFACLLWLPAVAEDWPCWRGPRGDGTSVETNVPTKWSEKDNLAWKIAIPGVGHSSPIVHGERIYLTTCDRDTQERQLLCLHRKTGQTIWNTTVLKAPLERKHGLNSFASSTPATDGKCIYVSFLDEREMFIAAYDLDGKQVWAVKPGVFSSVHGYCASPVLYKDKVIINGDHDGPAYLVALDRSTGKTLWKTMRENKTRSYCTPIIRDIGGRTQMILSGSKCVASFNPDDGSRHWIIDGPTEQYVASIVFDGKLLYMTAGFPQEHLMGIRPDGKGDVTRSSVAWHHATKDAAYVPSPAVLGGYLIVPDDFGTVTCYEARSGELKWREKLARHFSASAVSANGLVYLAADEGLERSEMGITFVIKPGATLDVVAKNVLDEPIHASPAISNGQILLRGDRSLYCVGK